MGLEYRTPGSVTAATGLVDDGDEDAAGPSVLKWRKRKRNIDTSPLSRHDSDSADSDTSSQSISTGDPSTISRSRLEILQNVFKHVHSLGVDSMCHDIITPAMLAGDDEMIEALLNNTGDDSSTAAMIKEQLLHLAVVHGRGSLVLLILESGADINSPPPGQSPALHQAVACHRRTHMVDLILGSNAAINATDSTGRTALGLAVSLGKDTVVAHLVNSGADVDLSQRPALPPLYEALLTGKNTGICRLLKSAGALTCSVDVCRLERVVREDWVSFSRTLVTHSNHGICKFIMLHKACELGKVDEVLSLLGDISFLTPTEGRKILSVALANKYVDIAKQLLSIDIAGLDDPIHDGKTALELCVSTGDASLVSMAMAKTKPSLYPLALLTAVHLENVAVTKLLLEAGTSQTDTLTQYPLTVAAQKGNDELVSLLLHHGGDPNYQNQHGIQPLEMAVEWGRDSTAETLVRAGALANPNLLAKAVQNRLIRLARCLLTHCSVDPNQMCPETGLSALQEESAKRDPNYDIIALLLRFGADIYQTCPWRTAAPSPLLGAIRERNTLLVKCLLDNHKCSRLRCRQQLPAVLGEADPLLLSDVHDSVLGHESRMCQQGGEMEEMDDMAAAVSMDMSCMGTGAASNTHASKMGHLSSNNPTHDGTNLHEPSAAAGGYAGHYGHHLHQHHHTMNMDHSHASPQQRQAHTAAPGASGVQDATVGGYGAFNTPHHPHDSAAGGHSHSDHQQQLSIDFRTMNAIYPYWNPVLLGIMPPGGRGAGQQ